MSTERIDLTELERDNALKAMISQVSRLTPSWTNPSPGDPLFVGLEVVASLSDTLLFYLEQRSNEMILSRARTESSIIDHGRLFDYRLRRRTAPLATLKLGKSSTYAEVYSRVIPTGFTFVTAGGISYSVRDSQVFDKTLSSVTLEIYGGVYHRESFKVPSSLEGVEYLRYPLAYPNVAENFLLLNVAGDPWEEDNFQPSLSSSFQKFTVDVDADGNATIVFDSFKNKLPQASANIVVRYLTTRGPEENVGSGTSIFPTVPDNSTLVGWEPGISSNYKVLSSRESAGAALEEDPFLIPRKVPAFLSTLWRCVALPDYKDVASLFPGVLSATAAVDPDHRYKLFVYIRPEGSPTEDLRSGVEQFLRAKSVIGMDIKVLFSPTRPVDITVVGTTNPATSNASIKSAVVSALNAQVNSLSVGASLTVDDVYQTLLSVDGLRSSVVTRMANDGGTTVSHLVPDVDEYITLSTLSVSISGGVG